MWIFGAGLGLTSCVFVFYHDGQVWGAKKTLLVGEVQAMKKQILSVWGKRVWAAIGMLGLWGLSAGAAPEIQGAEKWPRPTGQELTKAEKVVQEVFGREIQQAKTPRQKADLAREILKAAREEQDPALRFAALQAARRLAVSAQDGRLGLEIVRELVERFQPLEEMPPADRLAEADRLWQQAERLGGQEKLEKQLEAAEEFGWTNGLPFFDDKGNFKPAESGSVLLRRWRQRFQEIADFIPKPDLSVEERKLLKSLANQCVAFVNRKSDGALNVWRRSMEPGGHVKQWPDPANHPNAQWICVVTPEGYIRLRNRNSQLWLGTPAEGSPPKIAIQKAESDRDTLWYLRLVAPGYVVIVHALSGECLRPWDGTTNQGWGVHLYPPFDLKDPSFHWKIVPINN